MFRGCDLVTIVYTTVSILRVALLYTGTWCRSCNYSLVNCIYTVTRSLSSVDIVYTQLYIVLSCVLLL